MADEQKPGIDRPSSNGDNPDRMRPQDENASAEAGGAAGAAGAANPGAAGPAGGGAGGTRRTGRAGSEPRAGETERRPADELAEAYEKARDELSQAMGNLRTELGKVDLNRARDRARSWIDANPTLTLFIGIGAGILAGRLMSRAFRKPPVTVRARRQAEALGGQLTDVAEDIGEAVAHAVTQAVRSVGEVAAHGKKPAAKMVRRTREFGEDVAESAGRTVEFLEDAAEDMGKSIKKGSARAGKKARKKIDRGIDLSDAAVNALRTAVAAVVVKKVAGWVKNMR